MDRNKVLELAREADLYMTSDERIAAVERFAALIEREVHGDSASGDIHSCSYYCTRPECIRAQRDELRDRMESATASDAKPVAWLYDFLNPENRDEVIRNWLTQNPSEIEHAKGFNVRPLYLRPAPRC